MNTNAQNTSAINPSFRKLELSDVEFAAWLTKHISENQNSWLSKASEHEYWLIPQEHVGTSATDALIDGRDHCYLSASPFQEALLAVALAAPEPVAAAVAPLPGPELILLPSHLLHMRDQFEGAAIVFKYSADDPDLRLGIVHFTQQGDVEIYLAIVDGEESKHCMSFVDAYNNEDFHCRPAFAEELRGVQFSCLPRDLCPMIAVILFKYVEFDQPAPEDADLATVTSISDWRSKKSDSDETQPNDE